MTDTTEKLADHVNEDYENQDSGTSGNNERQVEIAVSSNDTSDGEKSKPEVIDTSALNGMRGIMAVHIMIFHLVLYNDTFWAHLLGSVDLSLFFLISGFVLALNEGKRGYNKRFQCLCMNKEKAQNESSSSQLHGENENENSNENTKEKEKEKEKRVLFKNFMQRRGARVLPMYFLTNIIVIPLIYVGYASFTIDYQVYGYISTFSLTASWLGIGVYGLLNPPSWFVSTIFCLYLFFPYILTKFQIGLKQGIFDIKSLKKSIIIHFALNIVIPLIIFGILVPLGYTSFFWFCGTFTPISRFPLFVMGVIAGILRLENYDICIKNTETPINYSKKVDQLSIVFIACFVIGSIVETFTGGASQLNFWFQMILPWWFLQYIYASSKLVTNEEKKLCKTYKFFNHKMMQFLGEISYGVYLMHFPLMYWTNFLVYGAQSEPSCTVTDFDICGDDGNDNSLTDQEIECCDEWTTYIAHRTFPAWAIPIVTVATILFAWILNKYFEKPMRKLLRPRNN